MWLFTTLAARVTVRHSVKNDHHGELILTAHQKFVEDKIKQTAAIFPE